MSFHPQTNKQLLLHYLAPEKGKVALLALLLLSSIALQLINPQLLRYFIDASQRGAPARALMGAGALFLVVALTQRGVALGATYAGHNLGWRATNTLREQLALHCLRLDLPFHQTHAPGELVERIEGDVSALANFFSDLVIRVLGNLLLLGGILLLLLRESWPVGLGLAGYALLTLVLLRAVQGRAVRRWEAARQAEAAQAAFVEERLAGLEDIRANGGEAYTLARLGELLRAVVHTGRAAFLMRTLTFALTRLSYASGYTLALGLGIALFLRGGLSLGTIYLIVAYIALMAQPLEEIRRQIDDLQQAAASIGRIRELFAIERAVRAEGQARLPAHPAPPSVSFENVSFAYDRTPVLHDLSFTVERGKVLGLLGRTGSGKSTLTRLLFRLYDPSSGTIRLDGVPLPKLPLATLRQGVGMVTQEVQLFQATVRDNLTLFNPQIRDEAILDALRELGLDGWVAGLPHGLDSVLASGGQGLSAGEAQLLALARVFLRDPGVVVLDEASSRLDPATEQRLERAIDRLLQGRTAIIIAHRLATVQRADTIMILEEGRIVEHGERVALAAHPDSHFARLLHSGLQELLA